MITKKDLKISYQTSYLTLRRKLHILDFYREKRIFNFSELMKIFDVLGLPNYPNNVMMMYSEVYKQKKLLENQAVSQNIKA